MSSIYFSKQATLNLQPALENGARNATCTCVPFYLCKNSTIITSGEGIIDIRKDKGPCNHFLLKCCKKEDQSVVNLNARPADPNSSRGCGFRRPNGVGFNFTGGKENESQFGEFPWMVAILGNGEYQCGGSLIHPSVVITAAHCVINKEKKFSVRAGEWDTQHVIEPYPHQDRDVKSIKVHSDYYSGALFNDIAFLILADPVNITENVDVICLPPRNITVNTKLCYANGWGKDLFNKEGKYQVILKKIGLPEVPRNKCQEKLRTTRLGKYFKLHESFMCAGGESGKDTCLGDGGSPLACPIEGQTDRYYQAGIVSWGIGCGNEGVPGVYTNVAVFRDWIDEEMKANNFETFGYRF